MKFIFPALLSCLAVSGFSQTFEENRDIKDVFSEWRGKPPSGPAEIQVGKKYISILPVAGYAPANGFLVGAAVSLSQLLAPAPTNLSSAMLNLQLTSKRQFIVNARSKIYLKNNDWFLQGDWRLMFFTQPTYGLGINNTVGTQLHLVVNNLSENTLPTNAEPMKFNYVRFYEDVVRRIGDKKLYVGVGIAVDNHFDIEDEKLDTVATSEDFYITKHYAYSVAKGFNTRQYVTSGFNLNILTDTRDVIANPYSGYFASLSFRFNPKIFKSSQASSMLNYDVRYYLSLSKEKRRKVLSFWSWGTFVTGGEVPYLALPSIGWDTYNRSGRGYIQGRYRGLNMVYTEAEYRFPLSQNGLWGGVAFLNCTFASGIEQKLFEKAAPGLGFGVRMKMDKLARVNLTADIGVGLDKSSGVYFGMQEVF